MDRKRIQVYADPETKRRIELAAAKHELAVTEYCLEAIRQYLTEDDMLEREKIEIPVKPAKDEDLVARSHRKDAKNAKDFVKLRGLRVFAVPKLARITQMLRGNSIASLRALREKIKARRGGKLITVDVIENMREERDNELLGLR